MVTITNGTIITTVPNSAYEAIFKRQGYHVVDGQPKAESDPGVGHDSGENEDEAFISQMKEKPLSQWNKDEVRKYAAINGIDISGTKNPTEAKHIIKNYMMEHSGS